MESTVEGGKYQDTIGPFPGSPPRTVRSIRGRRKCFLILPQFMGSEKWGRGGGGGGLRQVEGLRRRAVVVNAVVVGGGGLHCPFWHLSQITSVPLLPKGGRTILHPSPPCCVIFSVARIRQQQNPGSACQSATFSMVLKPTSDSRDNRNSNNE